MFCVTAKSAIYCQYVAVKMAVQFWDQNELFTQQGKSGRSDSCDQPINHT